MNPPENIVLKEADGTVQGITSVTNAQGHEVRPGTHEPSLKEGDCFHLEATGPARPDLDHPAVLEFAEMQKGWRVFVEGTAPRAGYFRLRVRFSGEFPLSAGDK